MIGVGLRGLRRVRDDVFSWLQRLSLRYHHGSVAGDIIFRAGTDTCAFQILFQQGLLIVISAFTKNPDAAWKVYRAWYNKETQMRNFKIAGSLSSRLDFKNSPEVQGDKFAQVFVVQTPYVKLEPLLAEWPKIGDAMITAIQESLAGIKTPEQALKDAHLATNRVLGVQ